MSEFDPAAWIRATKEGLESIAIDTLGLSSTMLPKDTAAPTKGIRGAYISLVDGEVSALIGLRSTTDDCAKLARYRLCMEEDEDVEEEDLTGTVSELANIIAGVVKSRLGEANLRLGIPMVVSGRVTPASQQETATFMIGLGEAKIEVLLLHRRKRRRPIAARKAS